MTVFLASQHEEYNGACLAGGLRGTDAGEGVRRGEEREKVRRAISYTQVHTADVSSIHLLRCKKSRTWLFFFPFVLSAFTHRQSGCVWRSI